MDEKKAYGILSNYLNPDLYIEGFNRKVGDLFLFFVKEKKYKDESFVLPTNYGVDSTGKVLDMDEVLEAFKKMEIG